MADNYAFNNGDEALAHLRQFGSMPLAAWFQRLLQTAPEVRAQQQQAAQGMTAQAPAMEAADPWIAQMAHQQAAQQAGEQSMPGDYNQAPQLPPNLGEGNMDTATTMPSGMGGGAPAPSPAPRQPMTAAAPASGMGPGNLQRGSPPAPGQSPPGAAPNPAYGWAKGPPPGSDTTSMGDIGGGFLKFFQALFGGGPQTATAADNPATWHKGPPPGSDTTQLPDMWGANKPGAAQKRNWKYGPPQ
jgi:hypothetical protein